MASFTKAFVFLALISLLAAGTGAAQPAPPATTPTPELSAELQQTFSEGMGLFDSKKYSEAAGKFTQVTDAAADYEPGFYFLGRARLADALTRGGDPRPALDAFLAAKRLSALRSGTSFMIGKIYEASLAFPQAIAAYSDELHLRQRNDVAEVYNALGRCYLSTGDMRDAQRSLEAAIEADPNYVEARYNLGRVLYVTRDYEGAVKSYLRARDILDEWDSKKRRLDILAQDQKRDPELTEEAVTAQYAFAQEFAQEVKGWPVLNKALGDAYDALRQHDYARNAYRASMSLTQRGNEADPDAHTRIGLSYLHEATELLVVEGSMVQSVHMFDAAIEELEKANTYDVNYAPAHDGLGQVYAIQAINFETDVGRDIKSHTLDDAIKEFKTALQLRPGVAAFEDHLGRAHYEAGSYEEAVQAYQRAIQADPNFGDAHADLARAYVALGQYQDALASAQTAVAMEPDEVRAQQALGLACYFTDDLPRAMRSFEKAISLRPDDYRSYLNLGNCYYVRESWHRARDEYNKALDHLPGVRIKGTSTQRSYIYYLLGKSYYNAQMYDSAITAYQQALAIDTGYWDALMGTAEAYTALKQYKAAQRAYDTALMLSPEKAKDALVRCEMGKMLEQAGEVHEAVAQYTRALSSDPNNLDAQRALERLQL